MINQVNYLKRKERILAFFAIILIFSCVYSYIYYLQQMCHRAQSSSDRCVAELRSYKYQLEVVTDYKRRLDKILKESQREQLNQNDMYKDIRESCVAMKQQSIICQTQFEDLQIECKKVKQEYNKVVEELKELKTKS